MSNELALIITGTMPERYLGRCFMRRAIGFVAAFLVLLSSGAAWSQWLYNGVALCTASGDQQHPAIVSDGSGGAIVTWMDSRSGNLDIYAQRVDGFGRQRRWCF